MSNQATLLIFVVLKSNKKNQIDNMCKTKSRNKLKPNLQNVKKKKKSLKIKNQYSEKIIPNNILGQAWNQTRKQQAVH